MTPRKLLILAICVLSFLTQSLFRPAEIMLPIKAQDDNGFVLVADVPVTATLDTKLNNTNSLSITGKFNLYVEASPQKTTNRPVEVKGLNLVFYDVPLAAISGNIADTRRTTLSMLLYSGNEEDVRLKYDPLSQTLEGEIPVQAYFQQIDEVFPPEVPDGSEINDFGIPQTQAGKVILKIAPPNGDDDISIAERLKWTNQIENNAVAATNAIDKITGSTSAKIEIAPLTIGEKTIPGYRINFLGAKSIAQVAGLDRYIGTKNLCIQPVNIRNNPNDTALTGKGFLFGWPHVRTLWQDYGITFQPRPWKTITGPWKETERNETSQILRKVNEPDCIEIFFVEKFKPDNLYGGGATWSSGTINAKVITSDYNAVCGTDKTHFAHELGHVLGLAHPGFQGRKLINPTPGTLMCPSGFKNDNPRRNSLANVRNASAHTFGIAVKPTTLQGLCDVVGRCGPCPSIGAPHCIRQ